MCLPSDASRNTYHLTWVSLILDVEYLFTASPPDLERGVALLHPPAIEEIQILVHGLRTSEKKGRVKAGAAVTARNFL